MGGTCSTISAAVEAETAGVVVDLQQPEGSALGVRAPEATRHTAKR